MPQRGLQLFGLPRPRLPDHQALFHPPHNANSFRVVTAIHYNRSKLYIRHVFTHAEYDRWSTRLKKGLS